MVQPFDQLDLDDQKTAIEIGCCCALLVTRLPDLNELVFEPIIKEFVAQYDIPANTGKYAMKAVGRELYRTSWTFTITKDIEGRLYASFVQGDPVTDSGEANGRGGDAS